MAELLVGTEAGVYALEEHAGEWELRTRVLDGVAVNTLVREAGGSVLAASRDAGLLRIDAEHGTIASLGVGSLPHGVRSVAVSPADPAVIYAGTEPAALYVSRDGGATWQENAGVAALRELRRWQYPGGRSPHLRHIMVDRTDPDTILAAVQIGGLLRTTDGGAHWTDVTADVDPDVHTIVQHPNQAEVFFAVCGGGGEYPHPTPEHRLRPPYPHGRPIYRSADRGATWTSISDGLRQSYGVPLAALGGDRTLLVAGVARGVPPRWTARPERADAEVIVSTDEGASWTVATVGLPTPFTSMVEAIEAEPRSRRVYVGTGGDGRDWVAADDPTPPPVGAIYYAREAAGPWTRIPLDLPPILALMASL